MNDDTTPMEFVAAVLGSCLGLGREEAHGAMLRIHTQGGALFATSSMAEAERFASHITGEAARRGYPLVCRAVGERSDAAGLTG